MADIVQMPGSVPHEAFRSEPDPCLVAKLEELLALAKNGDLRVLIYATVTVANATGSGWCGNAESHMGVAAVSRLFHRFVQADLTYHHEDR